MKAKIKYVTTDKATDTVPYENNVVSPKLDPRGPNGLNVPSGRNINGGLLTYKSTMART
jgi:hypothetical protein